MENRIFYLTTREEFRKFVSLNKYVVVKVTASWCGPCKRSAPLFNDLFQKLPESFVCVIVDVDEGKNLAGFFKFRSVPTLVNYIDGLAYDIAIGAEEKTIRDFFSKTLKRVK